MRFAEKVESSDELRDKDVQSIEGAVRMDSSFMKMIEDDSVIGVRVMHRQGLEGVLFLRTHSGRGWNAGADFGHFYSLSHAAFVDLGTPPNPFGYAYSTGVAALKEGGL